MKHLLFIVAFALAAATGARGQIYIDSYRFGAPASTVLLLDSITGASVGYSFRKLDKDYTGNCIMIRKQNGDSLNIGFVNNYLDTATIKTNCSGSDSCYVRIWYDQSGNANNAIQTTNTNQPRIVTGGILEKEGNHVSLLFDGTNDRLIISNAVSITSFSFIDVVKTTNTVTQSTTYFWKYTGSQIGSLSFNELWVVYGSISGSWSNERISFGMSNGTGLWGHAQNTNDISGRYVNTLYYNGDATISYNENSNSRVLSTSTGGAFSTTNRPQNVKFIGTRADLSNHFNGIFQEIIIYASDKSANNNYIQSNINNFYSIY